METLTQVNNEGCVDHASSTLSLSRIRGGGLKVKKFAARSFMATILVASTLLSLFSAVTSASAATTVSKGIYKPTSIGIGTTVGSSKNDPGVATYVGRDMYIGSNPSGATTLIGQNVIDNDTLLGSYAVEAEGLTVVAGKLAMRPLKESWGGAGFRFGTVGFGAQFRPESGTALAVAGNTTALDEIGSSEQAKGSVAAWNKGAWTGKSNDGGGVDYGALISGNTTYVCSGTAAGNESLVCTQHATTDSLNKILWQQTDVLDNINGNSYAKYGTYLTTLSDMLKGFDNTGKVDATGFAEPDGNYVINKYDKNGISYTLKFDGRSKTISGADDRSLNNLGFITNTERLITFTGDGKSMQQVFTIEAKQLSNFYHGVYYRGVDFKFNNIPEGASVIVNVTGDAPIEFHNGWRFWWNGTDISRGYELGSAQSEAYSIASQSIMWNFVDTTSLTIRGGIAGEGRTDWGGIDDKWTDDDPAAAMIGSILVPDGSFDCHVTTNGRVYVGKDFSMNSPKVAWGFNEGNSASVIDMDQERHNFPWSGSYTPDGSSIAWSKVDAADGTTPLPGSSWTIYGTVDDAKNGTNPIVTVTDGTSTDSASTAGELQFNYLNQKAKIGDSNDTNYFTYYIKEEKAPTGYQKSDTIYYAKMENTGEKVNYVQGYVDENGKEVPFKSTNPKGAISNTKKVKPVTLKGDTALTVQKTYAGRKSGWGENDKFDFTIEKVSFDGKTDTDELDKMPDISGATIGKPADGGTVNTAALGGADGVTFGQVGTYVYKVKETKGNLGGVTYDGHEATVTIVVSETASDGTYDGNLHATVTYDNSAATTDADKAVTTAATFTNTYADRPQKKAVGAAKNPTTSIDGKLVGVGDELVYTINWVNDAVDEKGDAAKAKVVVTDTLPADVDFKSADPKPTKQDGQTLTFDLGEKDANATGTIKITVEVNASAATTGDGELSNQATIQLGGNKAKTNTVTNHVPVKTETTNPGTIQVGQTLNYQIQFTADADGTTEVVDTLSKGLTYTANSAQVNGTASEPIVNGQKLAWNVPTTAGQTYTITFSVTVTEDAADSVNNTATVDGHSSNMVTTPQEQPDTLTISKTVTVEDNQGIDVDAAKDKAFAFTVALKDRNGNALTKSYSYTGTGVADGTITDGGTVTLKDGQSIQIAGLPAGAKYAVTETKIDGYTPDPVSGECTGAIKKDAASTAAFTNHYKVSEVKLDGATNLKVTKELAGRDWQAGDEFTFVLAADTTDDATKAAVDAGNIKLPGNATGITIKNDTKNHQAAFGDITFKQAGTFKFTITEKQGSLGGITYDTAPKTVTVKVADQGDGTLKATATEGANPTIANTYGTVVPGEEAAKTDVKFTKEFNGWSDADGSFNNTNFNFTLKAVTEGAPLPKKDDGTDNTTATVSKPASGTSATFSFGTINFTYDMVKDEPNKTKSFTYEITEDMPQGADNGKLNGISYDQGKATITITVTDKDGNGKMGVTVNVDKTTFTNTYHAEPVTVDANDALAGTKVLNAVNSDKKLAKGDFSFTAEAIDGTTVVPIATTATNEAPTTEGSNTGAFNFGSLTFTQTGTYTYKVTEDKGGTKADGYTYDGSVYTVTFTVTDNKQGKLVATRAITKGNEAKGDIVFTNTYEPTSVSTDAAGTLGGKKTVQASDGNTYELQAGDFSFQLTPGANAPGKVQTVQNKADGTYAFDPIPFTSAGTYSYTVSEVQATKGGFTFDGASYGVTFTVEDQNGVLKITNTQVQRVEGDNKADGKLGELNFTNKYDPKATSYTLSGTKVLESTDPSAQRALKDGEFTFQLTPINGTTGDVQTTTNAATGAFSFGTLNYTAPGVYTYEVRELAGKDSTITYDTNTVYTVTVTVEDQDGALTVTNVASVPVDGIVFKNTYTPTPVTVDPTAGDTKIGGTKTLTGRDAKAGEFTYELVDGSGTVVDTATSGDAKDGKAAAWTFAKKLEFTKTGTYRYTVREASGGTTAAGVTYDATTFGVTITVTEDADAHALRAQVTATKDGAEAPIAFANSYAAAPATVGFKAGKVLTGKDLTAGQFSFKLTGTGVNLTAKNDADGTVDFGTLTFKQTGTYTYLVSEVDDGQANVTYDDTAYKVVVTVTDHGTGQLQAQVTYDNDAAPVFQNSYVKPPKDDGKTDEQPPSKERPKTKIKKEQLAKTGDDTMIGVVASLVAAIGAIGAGVALHLKGRR